MISENEFIEPTTNTKAPDTHTIIAITLISRLSWGLCTTRDLAPRNSSGICRMFVPFSVRMRRAGMVLQTPLGYSFSGPQWVPEKKVDMAKVDRVIAVMTRFVGFWAANRASVPAWIKQDLATRQARADWLWEYHTANRIPVGEVSWYDLNEEAEAVRCVEDAFMAAEWEAERAAAEAARREAEARAAQAQARKEAENQRLLGLSDHAFRQICAEKLRICRGRGQDDALLQRWIGKMWAERDRIAAQKAIAAAPRQMRVARVAASGRFAALGDSDDE